MSGIVLSASVRQNLLSLQSTADLLATTQSRLSTGKKVNSALDNPTNFFTAAALDNRASDINNLLDGIGNGVQVLQAANTGITSLQKLVDGAKSVATQALQSTVGYSAKSSVSVKINGATASNLLGTGASIDAAFTGTNQVNNQTVTYTASTANGTAIGASHQNAYTSNTSTGTVALQDNAGPPAVAVNNLTSLNSGGANHLDSAVLASLSGQTLTINNNTITFSATATATTTTGNNTTIGLNTGTTSTFGDILTAIGTAAGAGVTATVDGTGHILIATGTTNDVTITGGAAATALGISTTNRGGGSIVAATATATTLIGVPATPGSDALSSALTTSDYLQINGKTIQFHAGTGVAGSMAANNYSIGLADGTIGSILSAINQAAPGVTATVDGTGQINIDTGTTNDLSLPGSLAGTLSKLGLSGVTSVTRAPIATPEITGATLLSGASTATSDALKSAFSAGDTITVNGKLLSFVTTGAADDNHINITDNITTLLSKIDTLSGNTGTGSTPSTVTGGHIVLHTGASSDLTITSSNADALAALGLGTGVSQARGTGPSPLNGQTLSIASTGGGVATSITFGGTGPGHVNSLNDLNAALSSNNLQATLAQDGTLTITTSNDAASATIGLISGTAALSGQLFFGKTPSDPVVDPNASAARDALVTQYNNILNQITTTAQDASFNGVNLLTGDTLRLTFNETGKSTLGISGVNFNSAGLGLAALSAGDFKDNDSVQKVVSGLNNASSTLRAQASAFGSNLSIVQIRQDFSKNLINVLQTGSSNLTLADTNEEAANSQALSTRQSIAVSALALANQSQQSVLQLLR
ncbi:flagellin [Bradyrhizobium sp. Leo121]|uniref:flagellin N-terminal helical domain-containing protein n=1 Tax=Bradyrhizobium sp. Leo121 TaxID=1571195 RepID=UPI0010298411|nr:flagellin [Bradyrhizobium sp. Leo121]RZN16307.1 flagellin [Bradyrhizobium sp. Leo121]